MGAEQSRMTSNKHRAVRKRLSLPLQLLTTTTTGRTFKPPSSEISQTTPGSSYSQPEGGTCGEVPDAGNSQMRLDTGGQFTEFEQDVLLSTWPLISEDLLRNGWLVFQNAFSIYPDLPNFFPFLHQHPETEEQNERANRHILAFMNVFADAIESLNSDREVFYEELMLLGARHAAIPNMKTEYFKIFKQAILMTWESLMYEEFTDEVRRAWAHLIDYVISILNEGCLVFEEEEEKMLSEAQPTPHRASDGQLLHCYGSTRRRSGQPSVVCMTPEELAQFYSLCK